MLALRCRLLAVVFYAAIAGPALAENGAIAGKIVDNGAPVGGAMVTARALASGIETTRFSRGDGTYAFDRLMPGSYEIEVKAPGKTAARRSRLIDDLSVARADFQLLPDPEYRRTVPSAHWMSLLPEGEMRREFLLNCASCHEIGYARVQRDGKPRTSADWLDAIAMMRAIDVYGLTPPDFDDARYAEWLARNLDAAAIAGLRPAMLATGAALDARITEYPVPKTPSLPHDIAVGPNGRVWVTAFYNNVVWALDPATGKTQAYPVNDKSEVMGQVRALTFDRTGMLWVLLGGTESAVRLDPASGATETFHVGMYPHSIEVDSNGKLWFNDYISAEQRIGSIDPVSGELDLFKIPSAGLTPTQGLPLLYGLQIDREDVIWGTMLAANKLFSFDSRSADVQLFDMPQLNSGPRRPGIGPDGAIWIPEFNTGMLTRFDPQTKVFTRHDLGMPTFGPYAVAVDQSSGLVWAAASLGSAMVRYDPATDSRDTYPLPTEPAYPRHIAIDATTGDVWTTYSSMPDAEPKIVRIEVRGGARGLAW